MNAIRIRQQVTSRVLEIPELDKLIGKDVEIRVLDETPVSDPLVGPKAGSARGEIWMSDDFDDPREDFADSM